MRVSGDRGQGPAPGRATAQRTRSRASSRAKRKKYPPAYRQEAAHLVERRFDRGALNVVWTSDITGPALAADRLTVDGNAYMTMKKATGSGKLGAVRLPGAHIGGGLFGDFSSVKADVRSQRLVLGGLTYRGIPNAGVDRWLDLIRHATPDYAAQPYRQLATAAAAEGHDAVVRRILIAQRRDQLDRATPRWRGKVWGWFTWVTLGYGYKPWRALSGLLAVMIISVGLTLGFGTHVLHPKDHPALRCTRTERVVLGIDNALPLVSTTVAASCLPGPGPKPAVQVVTWTGIGAQVTGWAFATLFVAGFTAAVRKT